MIMRVYKFLSTFFALSLLITFSLSVVAQDDGEIISPYFDFSYLKNSDDIRVLTARIYSADDLGIIPLPGLSVNFYTNMENPVLIGEAVTDEKGYAEFVLPSNLEIPVDEDGNWWFYGSFEGSENVEMSEGEVSVMDVNLSVELVEDEEGARVAILNAYTMADGGEVPVTDEDIYMFVPRMFSLLPIGEGYFEDGNTTIEFPEDIPGDAEGNLTVIIRFHDHWLFGNVERRVETQWGVPASHEVAGETRALWTEVAPTWMVITLTIMLIGVWGHYFFAIISLIRIKRSGKKHALEAGNK